MLSVPELRDNLSTIFQRYPEVQAVYLFGSYAQGTASERSDLDIGIVGPLEALGKRKLEILGDLAQAGYDRVDVVMLDAADAVLRFEVVSRNCLLYARDDFDHGGYFSRNLREYFDFEPYLRVQRDALKRRLQDGKT
jgi:predicted nucleotidyltransferase